MKVVEKYIVQGMKTYRPGSFSSRDKVYVDTSGNIVYVLWKTKVAVYNPAKRTLTFNSGGYRTITTKSRINAIAEGFGLGPVVIQKDFEWWAGPDIPWVDPMVFHLR